MISGFSPPSPPTSYCFVLGGCCQTRGSLPQGLLKACCVEGLCWAVEGPRLPFESCLSSSIQYGGRKGRAEVQPGRTLVGPLSDFRLTLSKEGKKSFLQKDTESPPGVSPPPVAWSLREVGCSANGDMQRQTSQALVKYRWAPQAAFSLSKWLQFGSGFYSFLSIGLWEKEEVSCYKTGSRELPGMVPVQRYRACSLQINLQGFLGVIFLVPVWEEVFFLVLV